MLRIRKSCVAVLVTILVLLPIAPSDASSGTTAAPFLTLSGIPRAAAMGDAFAAISADIGCITWNPAGLASLQKFRGTYTGQDNYHLMAAAIPTRQSHVVGVARTTSYELLYALVFTGDGFAYQPFKATHSAWLISYASVLSPDLTIGITGKRIKQAGAEHISERSPPADAPNGYETGSAMATTISQCAGGRFALHSCHLVCGIGRPHSQTPGRRSRRAGTSC